VDPRRLESHQGLRKAESAVLVQAQTDKISLNKYLSTISKVAWPDCPQCRRTWETAAHILEDCPR